MMAIINYAPFPAEPNERAHGPGLAEGPATVADENEDEAAPRLADTPRPDPPRGTAVF
jgi:hypothetical protein